MLYHFWILIFSARVPVWAATSFFKSPIVSSSLHFTRTFFPRRSLSTTSIIFAPNRKLWTPAEREILWMWRDLKAIDAIYIIEEEGEKKAVVVFVTCWSRFTRFVGSTGTSFSRTFVLWIIYRPRLVSSWFWIRGWLYIGFCLIIFFLSPFFFVGKIPKFCNISVFYYDIL